MSVADDFVDYLNAAVTGFHSVEEVKRRLRVAGFAELDERKPWTLQPGSKHFFSRNGSAICAFAIGGKFSADTSGAIVIGAHTDSPCLKLKPSSTLEKEGCAAAGLLSRAAPAQRRRIQRMPVPHPRSCRPARAIAFRRGNLQLATHARGPLRSGD